MSQIMVRVLGVSEAKPKYGIYLLLLDEVGGERKLPIIIGGFEAKSIMIALQGVELKRPIVYDMVVELLQQCDLNLVKVVVVRKSGEAYFSEVVVEKAGEFVRLDARTSDAVALALRYKAPIYVEEEVLDAAKDRVQVRHTESAPVDILYDEELEEYLKKSIESEQYERAMELRDEIKRRQDGGERVIPHVVPSVMVHENDDTDDEPQTIDNEFDN